MRAVTLSLALFVVLPAGLLATGVKKRSLGQARFTDTFSLLSKLNSNPYALNQAFPSAPISLSQSHSGATANVGDVAGLGALLGGTQTATVGSDAAADAVSDSIKDLFELDRAAAPKPAAAKPAAAKAAAPPAPKPKTVKASPAPKVAKVAAKAPPAPKAPAVVAVKKAAPKKAVAAKKAKPAVVVAAPKPVAKKAVAKTTVVPKAQKPTAVVAPPAPKPQKAPTKKMALAATATNAAIVSRESQLEAELAELKAKLAKASPAPLATPAKAAPPPAPKVAKKVESPVSKKVVPAPVAKEAVPAPSAKVVKAPVAKKVVAEAPAKKVVPAPAAKAPTAPAAKVSAPPRAAKAFTAKAHKVTQAAVTSQAESPPDYRDDEGEYFDGGLSTEPAKIPSVAAAAAAPVVAKVVAQPAAPPAAPPAPKAAPTEAPAQELTMTMVPQMLASQHLDGVQQGILTQAEPASTSLFGTVGHWFHSFFSAAAPPPAPVQLVETPVPDPDADRPAFSKQDLERTAVAAHEDGMSDVAIEDDFSRRETEDLDAIDRVKREDRALRIEAETPKRPSMPAPANFKHEAGSTHISSFWGTLADEDGEIEQALAQDGDDLTEYQRLKSLQDAKVTASVSEISGPLGSHMALERRALRKAA